MPGYWRFLQIECQLEQMIVQFFTLNKKAGTVHENLKKKSEKIRKISGYFEKFFQNMLKNRTN